MDGPTGNPRGRAHWRVTAVYPATTFVREYASLAEAHTYLRMSQAALRVTIERVWTDA